MKLLITGPQGSGKTTQAKILAEKLGLCLVKTGDLIRARAAVADELGRRLEEEMLAGDLTDDQVVADILMTELSHPKCSSGFIIDGYPRSLSQLSLFDPKYDHVVVLEVSEEVSIKRLQERGREDDTKEAITERLKIYKEKTEEVINHYQSLGIVKQVDGEKSVEEVTEQILSQI